MSLEKFFPDSKLTQFYFLLLVYFIIIGFVRRPIQNLQTFCQKFKRFSQTSLNIDNYTIDSINDTSAKQSSEKSIVANLEMLSIDEYYR